LSFIHAVARHTSNSSAIFSKQKKKSGNNKNNDTSKSRLDNWSNKEVSNYYFVNSNLNSTQKRDTQYVPKPFHSSIGFNFANVQTKPKVIQPGDVYKQETEKYHLPIVTEQDPNSSNVPRRKYTPAKLMIAPQQDQSEQLANKIEEQVAQNQPRSSVLTALRSAHPPSSLSLKYSCPPGLPVDAGAPLSMANRNFMEPIFREDFSKVRLHTSPIDRKTADMLGARAFAYNNHIWLGSHESETDKSLISHELVHVLQQGQGLVYLRRATGIERRAWLSFFWHYLPRKLLNNYMDDTGKQITLTQQEMIDCNPIIDLHRSQPFLSEVAKLKASGGGTKTIAVSGWGGALTNGTLGNFTINYKGSLTVTPAGTWTFTGKMDFFDIYDFDPKEFGGGSGRPITAEIKVRVANIAIPGRAFRVTSVQVPVTQTNATNFAIWADGSPSSVRESKKTAVDIEVGAGAGGVVSPPAEVGGAEVGAQSAEELNR
jgi:hypothetical protein